jgi:1-acyl-sn-glycerol-3-phosphate acyltransferase
VWQARLALGSLWLSQVARVAADNTLRFFVVLLLYFGAYHDTAWYLVTGLLMAPAVLLAPFNGAITNSLPKPAVLISAAALGLAATAPGALGMPRWATLDWLVDWTLVAIAAALYGPTRYALLPAASENTRWPLTRLNGVFEMGAAGAVVAALLIALRLEHIDWAGYPAAAVLAALLGGVALVFALPVRFANDVRRPEPVLYAVRSFFADARAIIIQRELRVCLVGLALLRAVVTGLSGALLPRVLTDAEPDLARVTTICTWIGWVTVGLGLGSLIAGLERHPRRVLGLVPWGAIGLAAGMAWAAGTDDPQPALLAFVGIMAGLINVPLAATYQADLPADARGNGMAVRNFTDYVAVALASLVLYMLAGPLGAPSTLQVSLLAAVVALAGLFAGWFFRRESVELLIEAIFLVMYRFRATGPGLDVFPRQGPVLVIANHSAWLDPPWLAKVLPRRIIAMMTSVFYDVPILRWMMIHLAQAIRVQAGTFRRDVPEIGEAVAALDRGECLLVFPEGAMRRSDERPLRMFGQGVWHILRERPETPVVVCWIEGGWGSYFSYKGGQPTKNKRLDFLRRIGIAVGTPHLMPADILGDQRRTRLELMRECLEMRRQLGLEPFALEMGEEG